MGDDLDIFRYCKVFVKADDLSKAKLVDVTIGQYNDSLVTEQGELGYQPFTLPVDLFTAILDYYILYHLSELSRIEYNTGISSSPSDKLNQIDSMEDYFKLKDKVERLCEENPQGIRKVKIKSKEKRHYPLSLEVQANGLIGFRTKHYNYEKETLSLLVNLWAQE